MLKGFVCAVVFAATATLASAQVWEVGAIGGFGYVGIWGFMRRALD